MRQLTEVCRTVLPPTTDVLIVGAGPTGMALAIALQQAGVKHVVIDKLEQGLNTSRAGVIHAHTLEVLEELGVSRELVERGLKITDFCIRDRDRILLKLRFDALPSAYRYLLMLPQDITEKVLTDRLAALGGGICRGFTATAVEEGSAGVTVTMTTPSGDASIRAQYVVGADGMHSIVRAASGTEFEGGTYEDSFVLADVRMDWPIANEVSLFFSPSGLLVVAPLPNGSFRVVATVTQAPEQPGLDDIQALVNSRGPAASPAIVEELLWSSRFRLHHRVAKSYRNGRLLLMGDAAHVHSPAGGQGMNTGLVDAVVLGRLLAKALRSAQPDAVLEAYQGMRRPAASKVLALAGRLTAMATLRGAGKLAIRNGILALINIFPPARRRILMQLSGLSRKGLAQLPGDDAPVDAAPGLHVVNRHLQFPKVSLRHPSASRFIHIAAEIDSRPVFFPDSRRKKRLIAACKAQCRQLQSIPGVYETSVFSALLAPPGRGELLKQRAGKVHVARFDLAILIECESKAAAETVLANSAFTELMRMVQDGSRFTHTITASNTRRIGPVDHSRPGVFLFNYFFADSPEQNLAVWEYTAGWFQAETGLDNSTVLLPEDAALSQYSIINHCRWDSLRQILPSLIFKRSFHSYVLDNFAKNNVAAMPILYRLA